jgi:broad specificity phosphatase PhoE
MGFLACRSLFARIAVIIVTVETCHSYIVTKYGSQKIRAPALFGRLGEEVRPFRRQVLGFGSLAILGAVLPLQPVSAKEMISLDCLSDLPSLDTDSVRIYLCRHGQTENNRLGLVQGARLDPSINARGQFQAQRLGEALSRAATYPGTFFYSPLARARETAELATGEFLSTATPSLKLLPSLAEIDVGAIAEGRLAVDVRSGMIETYANWASGDIDRRMAGGGESGREVLSRVQDSLRLLVENAAASESRSIAAIAHSGYLKVLLLCLQDNSLLQYSVLEQKNCCINVLDLKKDGSSRLLNGMSKVLGSRAPLDLAVSIPVGNVLRINESRHLIGIK